MNELEKAFAAIEGHDMEDKIEDETMDNKLPLFEIASNFEVPAPEWLKEHMRKRRYCLKVEDEKEERK